MPPRHGLVAASLALLLVFAGCSAPGVNPNADAGGSDSDAPTLATPDENFSDPEKDVLGWEDGYWYGEPIRVDQSDGLSDEEMRAFVGRSMARVEYVRHKEFRKRVSVEVLSRAEYRNRSTGTPSATGPSEFDQWNNQVWEALFITGEAADSQSSISGTRESAVAGFYSPRDDEIKIITDSPDSPTIDNATLVHELTHALQDQHYDLTKRKYTGQTQDGDLAIDGAVEGSAKYVELRYAEMCEGEWSCVPAPQRASSGSSGNSSGGGPNLGIFLTIFQPYSDGPVFIAEQHRRGGWDAVDAQMENPPESSEQVIHRTDEKPVRIQFRDRGRNGWSTFRSQGQGGSDTVGEASIFAMFWYQARTTGADTVNPRSILQIDSRYDTYNYDAKPSNGWGNDRLFPYKKGSGNASEYGYVWVTEWDSEADARQFQNAYQNILSAHGATKRGENTYVVPNGEFEDAFRVTRDGTRVVIVNGPTPKDLDDIRPRQS
ncbi:Hvo_1808 family surface protein [Halopelagius fulvigenes]|uniref:Hvo_1808 family surface protein n=1 Tax=Halopelagius fulvigenes TaxID=1198324 RepID=A0ABD5TX76_9EURY